jgi:Dual specificity phosphatase, catalytic domain
MRHRHLIGISGVSMLTIGVIEGGALYLVAWLGLNFCALAIGHIAGTPAILGKKRTGILASWSWVLFFPLHLYTIIIWHLYRILNTESPFNRVAENLIIGRRLLPGELSFSVENYIDLTAEFEEPAPLRCSLAYTSFPIFDGSIPKKSDLDRIFSELREGALYIHCAQGHGRTGLVAAAYLLFTNRVTSADEGISILQKARSQLRLSREQIVFLKEYEKRG